MTPIHALPKNAKLLITIHIDCLEYFTQPLSISGVPHGIGYNPLSTYIRIYTIENQRQKALKVLRLVTSTIDHLSLSKAHVFLYSDN